MFDQIKPLNERVVADANGRKYITTEPKLNQGPDYERGFVDGMLHQTQSSVDKAVNRMAQPAQEPVAFYNPQHGGFYWAKPTTISAPQAVDIVPLALYASPQPRPWVGLTAQEAAECWTTSATQTWKNFESALRSKNI
jgi:hypothetical protein